jgi:hypothetical protein
MQEVQSVEHLRSLPLKQQKRAVQDIHAGTEHPLFVGIKEAFLADFPQCGAAGVFCGMAGGLVQWNAITVTTKPGQRIIGLPKTFLGMPVIRHAQGRFGTWLPTGDS